MRLFLDANILFSASKSNGAIRFLITKLLEQKHTLHVSAFVLEEARRNLAQKDAAALDYFETLKEVLELVVVSEMLSPSIIDLLPMKDQPVLQAAIESQCDILLTGDKTHFGKLYDQKIETVIIHSPRSLAELLKMI